MPLSDPDRITQDLQSPRILTLWRALQPLKTVTGFMNTGAHPDDEISGMLAALTFRDGLNLSYICAVRGEGGQNDIGTEVTEDLGTIRTAEMERASDVLDMRLYWLSQTPADSIIDFGLSKSGIETMEKWGRDRVLARFVELVRTEKPDIICPTFLDVPGQHGHHRAMTEAAHLVMDLAADPGFSGSELPAWQVSKLYLPAWSGAGGAYDDEAPPPPATLRVPGNGQEEVSGWSWPRIGQQSRRYHKSQGMGRWVAAGAPKGWPLHLVRSEFGPAEDAVTDHLPVHLTDLRDDAVFASADRAIADAIAAFPNRAGILSAAISAQTAVITALQTIAPAHRHRLIRKHAQLARVIRIASGADLRGWLDQDILTPGQSARLHLEVFAPDGLNVDTRVDVPDGWDATAETVTPGIKTPPSDPYPDRYDPLSPPAPRIAATIMGTTSYVPLETSPLILPDVRATLSQNAIVVNLTAADPAVSVTISDCTEGIPSFDLPEGWQQHWQGGSARISVPSNLDPGLYDLPLRLDNTPATTARIFRKAHIAPRLRCFPTSLKIRALHISTPDAKIGYIGGGNDRVAHWLAEMGCDVQVLTPEMLAAPAPFAGVQSIIIGVIAFKFRPDLRDALPALHAWIKEGGNLVTLYQRPWDNWDPDTTPPAHLEIGQPSLRWRVTDETAEVRHLNPDHPLLTTPNQIGPEDWQGWHKERGLYFAKSWDDAYQPLLEMADPEEAPHQGAFLSARIGKGRHTHSALILHHQLEKLTPGAFRLIANLLAATPPRN